jgi:hypothetical protein
MLLATILVGHRAESLSSGRRRLTVAILFRKFCGVYSVWTPPNFTTPWEQTTQAAAAISLSVFPTAAISLSVFPRSATTLHHINIPPISADNTAYLGGHNSKNADLWHGWIHVRISNWPIIFLLFISWQCPFLILSGQKGDLKKN